LDDTTFNKRARGAVDMTLCEYALETKDIIKTFPGVKALDKVSIKVKKGEVHGIVGENGAGKSTLMNVLTGALKPDSGKIIINGEEVAMNSPREASLFGVEIVYQELSLVSNLSIAENIFPNKQPIGYFNMIDQNMMHKDTKKILALFNMEDISPTTLVSNLSMAHQQVIEILKAISNNPRLLILDEPTSSLTKVERELLFENVRRLKQEGASIIYISHHLNEIFEICDRVTILKDGKYVCDAPLSEINEDYIITNMVGREIKNIFGSREVDFLQSRITFECRNIHRKGVFNNISFHVKQGEILGFYGLIGAGRTEVARAIFGVEPIDGGEIMLDGRKVKINSPKQAINNNIGYMTEDRKAQGIYLKMGVASNLISNRLSDFSKSIFLSRQMIEENAHLNINNFKIVTPNLYQNVENLSGGNQQKVLIATWFGITPKVLIIDEPTRGVDVGARSDIYTFIRSLAETGTSIIIISSDLLEVLGLSDRINVMKDGEIVGELDAKHANEENVIALATGVHSKGIGVNQR
jgi:ABC-type sugar transport system ATPase subunit